MYRLRYFVQPISVHFWKLGKSLFNNEWTWQHFNNNFLESMFGSIFGFQKRMLLHLLECTKLYETCKFFQSRVENKSWSLQWVSAVVFLKKNIKVRQAKTFDLFLQSQVTNHVQERSLQRWNYMQEIYFCTN